MSNSMCIVVVSIPNINVLRKFTLQIKFVIFKRVHTHDVVLYYILQPVQST